MFSARGGLVDHAMNFLKNSLNIFTLGSVIASMLGISLRTVRRRMNEFGLSVRSSYSDIDDDELKRAVQQIKVNFPCSGYRIIDGLLRQRGIRVQQLRLRKVIQSIDPHGITM